MMETTPPPADGAPAPLAFTASELRDSLRRPHRLLDIVLGDRPRLGASVATAGASLPLLLGVLIATSVACAVPFAVVDGAARILDVALLFTGSVLLCVPALHVFGVYLGVRMHPLQALALSLVIPSTAALFTLGFAPIYWFLDATMPADGVIGGPATRLVLLLASLLLALGHVNRCVLMDPTLRGLMGRHRSLGAPLWIGWQLVLVFLTFRMATTLDLLS